MAFRIGNLGDSNLIAKKLADNHPVILASEDFIKEHGQPKTPEELIKLPAVFYASDGLVVNRIPMIESLSSGEAKSWEFQGHYRVNEPELIIDAVRSGLGFAVVGRYMLDKPLSELGLVPLLTNYQFPDYFGGIYAVYPHRNPTLLVNKFIEMMQDEIGDIK